MKTTVAAIDFGTSKIVTLVAENSGTQRCDIVGAGVANYDGFLEEGWNNPGELDQAIRLSIEDAEKQSHHKIHEIRVGVPGAFTRVYATEVEIELNGTDPRVEARDTQTIFNEAGKKIKQIPGVVVHRSPAWFMVDDGKKTLEPVGQKGHTLKAIVSFVIASQLFVDDVKNRLEEMGVTATMFFSSPVGEAMLYLPEEDRDRTAVLIDIGYLNTEVMIVEGDALLYHKTIEIGGGHISADLSMGLDISLTAAEQIKRSYVYGLTPPGTTYEASSEDGQKPLEFTREQVADVLEPRVDEIADEIKLAIEESGVKLGNWSNIYLTGGGLAMNRGGKDYLAGQLERPVRETPKRTAKLNSHTLSSALGLIDLIISIMENDRQPTGGAFGGVKDFFRNLIGG